MAVTPARAQALLLEERQMDPRPRVPGPRHPRLLGALRIQQQRRPLEGRALLRVALRSGCPPYRRMLHGEQQTLDFRQQSFVPTIPAGGFHPEPSVAGHNPGPAPVIVAALKAPETRISVDLVLRAKQPPRGQGSG